MYKILSKNLFFDHGSFKLLYPHGFYCFYPSCSQPGVEAVEKYGIIKVGFKTI